MVLRAEGLGGVDGADCIVPRGEADVECKRLGDLLFRLSTVSFGSRTREMLDAEIEAFRFLVALDVKKEDFLNAKVAIPEELKGLSNGEFSSHANVLVKRVKQLHNLFLWRVVTEEEAYQQALELRKQIVTLATAMNKSEDRLIQSTTIIRFLHDIKAVTVDLKEALIRDFEGTLMERGANFVLAKEDVELILGLIDSLKRLIAQKMGVDPRYAKYLLGCDVYYNEDLLPILHSLDKPYSAVVATFLRLSTNWQINKALTSRAYATPQKADPFQIRQNGGTDFYTFTFAGDEVFNFVSGLRFTDPRDRLETKGMVLKPENFDDSVDSDNEIHRVVDAFVGFRGDSGISFGSNGVNISGKPRRINFNDSPILFFDCDVDTAPTRISKSGYRFINSKVKSHSRNFGDGAYIFGLFVDCEVDFNQISIKEARLIGCEGRIAHSKISHCPEFAFGSASEKFLLEDTSVSLANVSVTGPNFKAQNCVFAGSRLRVDFEPKTTCFFGCDFSGVVFDSPESLLRVAKLSSSCVFSANDIEILRASLSAAELEGMNCLPYDELETMLVSVLGEGWEKSEGAKDLFSQHERDHYRLFVWNMSRYFKEPSAVVEDRCRVARNEQGGLLDLPLYDGRRIYPKMPDDFDLLGTFGVMAKEEMPAYRERLEIWQNLVSSLATLSPNYVPNLVRWLNFIEQQGVEKFADAVALPRDLVKTIVRFARDFGLDKNDIFGWIARFGGDENSILYKISRAVAVFHRILELLSRKAQLLEDLLAKGLKWPEIKSGDSLENLTLSGVVNPMLDKKVAVANDVELPVRDGGVVVLAGPNSFGGKSTLKSVILQSVINMMRGLPMSVQGMEADEGAFYDLVFMLPNTRAKDGEGESALAERLRMLEELIKTLDDIKDPANPKRVLIVFDEILMGAASRRSEAAIEKNLVARFFTQHFAGINPTVIVITHNAATIKSWQILGLRTKIYQSHAAKPYEFAEVTDPSDSDADPLLQKHGLYDLLKCDHWHVQD